MEPLTYPLLNPVFAETLRGLINAHVRLADSHQGINNELLLKAHNEILSLLSTAPKGYDFTYTVDYLYRHAPKAK